MRPIEIILLIAVGFLLWDKFKPKASTANQAVVPLNGASGNTAPNLIKNYSETGDTFDVQVEALTKQLGY